MEKPTPPAFCCGTLALQKAEDEILRDRENEKFFKSLGLVYITRENFYKLQKGKK